MATKKCIICKEEFETQFPEAIDEWVEDQSVDFITAITAFSFGREVRLEDKYLNKLKNEAECIHDIMFIDESEYLSMNILIHLLTKYFDRGEFSEIILNAKWYLKEED